MTSNEETIAAEIIGLLRERVGRCRRIEADTNLFVDLGLFGDDAAEFLHEFSMRFNVDLSQFLFESHFLYEGHGWVETLIMPLALWRRYCQGGRRRQNRIPITVGRLVEAVGCGHWLSDWSRVAGAAE